MPRRTKRRKKPSSDAVTKKDDAKLMKFIKVTSLITLTIFVILYFVYNGFG